MRLKLEEECKALAAFVGRFDSFGLVSEPIIPSRLRQPSKLPLGPTAFASRRRRSYNTSDSINSSMSRSSSGLTAVHEVESLNNSFTHSLSIALTGDSVSTLADGSPTKKGTVELMRSVREAPSLLDFSSELAEVEDMMDLSFEGAQTSFSVMNGADGGIDKLGEAISSMDLSRTPTGTPTIVKTVRSDKPMGVSVADKENILSSLH